MLGLQQCEPRGQGQRWTQPREAPHGLLDRSEKAEEFILSTWGRCQVALIGARLGMFGYTYPWVTETVLQIRGLIKDLISDSSALGGAVVKSSPASAAGSERLA